jgi:hypothetical protein
VNALDRRLAPFLRRWDYISFRHLHVFADAFAGYLRLPATPRLAHPLLRRHGVEIRREPLPPTVHAVWTRDGGDCLIRLSEHLPPGAVNFTLWHEWFDLMAHHPDFPNRPPLRTLERCANRFASCIAMPEEPVRLAFEELNGRGDKTSVMAARFAVSSSAMRVRLSELNLRWRYDRR